MQERFDFGAYAQQVRRVSRTLLCSGRKMAEISGGMHLLTVASERDLLRFAEASEISRVACGPGCGACCVLNVSVLFPEAIAISRYLERSLTDRALQEVRVRLHELLVATRWLDAEERLFLRETCAFLGRARWCTIHSVRPLLCRAISSTNPSACREAIAMVPLDGQPTVEMNLFQKNLFDTVFWGLGAALEDSGLEHRPMRLPSAVLALLEDPEMVDAFAAGERITLN